MGTEAWDLTAAPRRRGPGDSVTPRDPQAFVLHVMAYPRLYLPLLGHSH